jgi:hypothetical protein
MDTGRGGQDGLRLGGRWNGERVELLDLSKINFLGPSDFTKEWKEVIGEENLPKYLGGSLDWAPPSGGNMKKLLESKGIKPEKVSISRRGDHKFEVNIFVRNLMGAESFFPSFRAPRQNFK